MRILFDHGTPVPLRRALTGHTDQNLRYQQNLSGRTLAILVLPTTSWPIIQEHIDRVAAAIDALRPGDFVELKFE